MFAGERETGNLTSQTHFTSIRFKIVDSATDVQKWLCDSYGQKQVLPTGERCTQYLFGIIMRSGWFVLPKKSQRCPNSLLLVSKWSHKDNLYQNPSQVTPKWCSIRSQVMTKCWQCIYQLRMFLSTILAVFFGTLFKTPLIILFGKKIL